METNLTISSVRSLLACVTTAALLSACGGGGNSSPNSATSATSSGNILPFAQNNEPDKTTPPVIEQGNNRTITFMHYNDLHAHLNPHPDLVSDGQGGTKIEERGGIARAATLIKQIRSDNPDSLLMNIGDTYHGGAEAWFTLGNAIVPPVNALGIDVGVPGNWDFGYSSTIFRLRYADTSGFSFPGATDKLRPEFDEVLKPNFPNLAANLSTLTGREVLPATFVKNVNGVKVGFIGLTSDIVKFVYELLAPAFTFTGNGLSSTEAETAYKMLIEKHANDLRSKGADIVVVMSELGIHKDQRLANIVAKNSIDVFFSAHTHEATIDPRSSTSGALVVEAGNDGYLGRMDITVDASNNVINREWVLLPIDSSLEADAEVQAIVDKMRAPFMAVDVNFSDPMPNSSLAFIKPLDSVIGHTDFPLNRRDAMESTFNNAMGDIMRHYSGAELSMTPGFRFDSVIAPGAILEDNTVLSGDVTVEDAYRFFPMMFTVAKGEVTGKRLKEVLEESLTRTYSTDAFKHAGGWLEGWSGLSLSLNLANPDGQRVLEMRKKDNGEIITDDSVLSIAGCKRPIEPRDMICRHSGFTNVQPMFKQGISNGEVWTMLDFFIEAVAKGVAYDPTRNDIIDINSTPVWPDTQFIQPVEGVQ